MKAQLALPLNQPDPVYDDAARFTELPPFDGVPARVVDIPESIPKLGYGTHQFFRYYGKFPSVLGRLMISRFAARGDLVGDCYVGSGTSMVEAQIQGCPSFGLDINPLAVFASNVKTRYYDHVKLEHAITSFLTHVRLSREVDMPSMMSRNKLDKWFSADAQQELGRIRHCLVAGSDIGGAEHDFITLAFLAIVRRVSTAYDGEVRPHVNPGQVPPIASARP